MKFNQMKHVSEKGTEVIINLVEIPCVRVMVGFKIYGIAIKDVSLVKRKHQIIMIAKIIIMIIMIKRAGVICPNAFGGRLFDICGNLRTQATLSQL